MKVLIEKRDIIYAKEEMALLDIKCQKNKKSYYDLYIKESLYLKNIDLKYLLVIKEIKLLFQMETLKL